MKSVVEKRNFLLYILISCCVGLIAMPAYARLQKKIGPERGTTSVNLPQTLCTVHVDPQGAISGSCPDKIRVAHSDSSTSCAKVNYANVIFEGACPESALCFHYASPPQRNLNLCNFNFNDAVFDLIFPLINAPTQRAAVAKGYSDLCKAARPSNAPTQTITSKHPWFNKSLEINLIFNNGDHYQELHDVPPVMLTCDTCPQMTLKQSMQLKADEQVTIPFSSFVTGGIPPYNVNFSNIPTGMKIENGNLTGKPAKNTFTSQLMVHDSCATAYNLAKNLNFRFEIVDAYGPELSNPTVQPNLIPRAGGYVTMKVSAKDNNGVKAVNAKITKPTGGQESMKLMLSDGTEKNGTWLAAYKAPAISGTQNAIYKVSFEAEDGDKNKATLAGPNFTVEAADRIPPRVISFLVTPKTFDHFGGDVTVTFTALDDVGVQQARIYFIKPDGSQSATPGIPITTGYPKDANYKYTFKINPNTTSTDQIYSLYAKVTDGGGNSATSQTLQVTVQANPSGSAIPAKPSLPKGPPRPGMK